MLSESATLSSESHDLDGFSRFSRNSQETFLKFVQVGQRRLEVEKAGSQHGDSGNKKKNVTAFTCQSDLVLTFSSHQPYFPHQYIYNHGRLINTPNSTLQHLPQRTAQIHVPPRRRSHLQPRLLPIPQTPRSMLRDPRPGRLHLKILSPNLLRH